jgi:hypothetical protein
MSGCIARSPGFLVSPRFHLANAGAVVIRWTTIAPSTEASEVWRRDVAAKRRDDDRPLGCLVRTVHHDGETVASVPIWIPNVTLLELLNGGHP